MLKYMRNKAVDVTSCGEGRLDAHGVLIDDLYSVELDVAFAGDPLTIESIEGRWHKWTTPECPRALMFLSEAVGLQIVPGLNQKVHKLVGRKACRHFANLLLEMCRSAEEAQLILAYDRAAEDDPDLDFGDFLDGRPAQSTSAGRAAEPLPEQEASGPQAAEKPGAPRVSAGTGFALDLHVHTWPASPCASSSLDEVLAEAKSIGLDGVCLTDHNHVWPAETVRAAAEKHDLVVLRGNEITTDQGDMLVFGLERNIEGIIPIRELAAEVERAGGCMIAAHPFRGFLVFGARQVGLTPEKAMQREVFSLVGGLEVMNGKVTAEENDFAARVASGLTLPGFGGSDAHEASEVGDYATIFDEPLATEAELIEALRAGKGRPAAYRREVLG